MKEANIVRQILDYLNSLPFCHAEKVHGSAFGMPTVDITGCINGRRFDFEVKVPGKHATPRQRLTLVRWAAAGAVVGTVHDVEEVRELLEDKRSMDARRAARVREAGLDQ